MAAKETYGWVRSASTPEATVAKICILIGRKSRVGNTAQAKLSWKEMMVDLGFWVREPIRKFGHPLAWLAANPRAFAKVLRAHTRLVSKERCLATLPRSGTNYIIPVLTCASELEAGRSGEYQYVDDGWVFETELIHGCELHNVVSELARRDPVLHENSFFHSHHPIQRSNLLNLNSMKVVFTVRDIYHQLESWLLYTQNPDMERVFAESYARQTVNHFNYWGEFMSRPDRLEGVDFLCIRFEDLLADPYEYISKIARMWGLNLGEASLKASLELCSRESMLSRIPPAEVAVNKRVPVRSNRGKVFSEESLSEIRSIIDDNLEYDFGYGYLDS